MLVWSTGSGLVCLLLERWSVDHEKKLKLSFNVRACQQIPTAIAELYAVQSRAHANALTTKLCTTVCTEKMWTSIARRARCDDGQHGLRTILGVEIWTSSAHRTS